MEFSQAPHPPAAGLAKCSCGNEGGQAAPFASEVNALGWAALRFVNVICLAGLFTAADSWISNAAPT